MMKAMKTLAKSTAAHDAYDATSTASSVSDDIEEQQTSEARGTNSDEVEVQVDGIQEGGNPRCDPTPSSLNRANKNRRDSGYSAVTAKYDRNNKGYLDETEMALRKMDSQNLGHLNFDKMYSLMEDVQSEQKRSASLMDELQKHQATALNLKREVIALCCLAFLLALANIGTYNHMMLFCNVSFSHEKFCPIVCVCVLTYFPHPFFVVVFHILLG